MKVEVRFYVAGKMWEEVYEVNNYDEAKLVGKQRNPQAKIISVNWKG
jgi:hypothetical protein